MQSPTIQSSETLNPKATTQSSNQPCAGVRESTRCFKIQFPIPRCNPMLTGADRPQRSHHLVPVVPVAGGARDEHGPLRPHLILPLRRRRSSSVTPLLRRHPYQRLPLPLGRVHLRTGGGGGQRQEREEEPAQPRSSHRWSRGCGAAESERQVGAIERVMAAGARTRGPL